MAGSKIRLFQLASQINIGKDTIVEFLTSKGFSVENKATTIITEEMQEAVYDKYSREVKAVETQRKKVENQKQVKKPTSDEKEVEETPITFGEVVEQPQVASEPKIATIVTEEKPQSVEIKSTETIQDVKPEVVVKVEVDSSSPDKQNVEEKATTNSKQSEPEESKPIPSVQEILSEEPEDSQLMVLNKKQNKPVKDDGRDKSRPKRPDENRPQQQPGQQRQGQQQPGQQRQSQQQQGLRTQQQGQQQQGQRTQQQGQNPNQEANKGLKIVGRLEIKPKQHPKPRMQMTVGQGNAGNQNRNQQQGNFQQRRPNNPNQPQNRTQDVYRSNEYRNSNTEPRINPNPPIVVLKSSFAKTTPTLGPDKEKGAFDKKAKKKRMPLKPQVNVVDVDKAIRKTLSDIDDSSSGTSTRMKNKMKKKVARDEKEVKRQEEIERESQIIKISEYVTVAQLANLLNVPASQVIVKCMQLGLMVSINQRLDKDTVQLIVNDYGFDAEFLDDKAVQLLDEEEDIVENLIGRPPIVTIMGHVDHGKTSLLDFIRTENVVAGEAGGITQHIGAYHVDLPKRGRITFLDTPGHEAFTAMRARGATVTDIVILVVAADDSVMPQTIEAIAHAKAANSPIIVALNKMDKPDANPDRIKQQLSDHGVLIEEWGGKYQCVPISAKTGMNVDLLLETIILESELLELKADPQRKARGTVIESHVDKGKGNIATVIVQKGTLKIGDPFIAGMSSGRVRAMYDERGRIVNEAGPSIPVQLTGFDLLPNAGDIISVTQSESEAKQISSERQLNQREQQFRQVRHMTLDDISKQIQIGGVKELRLIIKGDFGGSVEALSDSLLKLSRTELNVRILHKGVGTITESDIMLASASDAIIIGFQVNVNTAASQLANSETVDVRLYNIIYDCINEIQLALEGLLDPDLKEEITSTIIVRQVFRISKVGSVAGCYVQSGKITRNDKIRILRDGLPIYKGTIHSLKRIKDDVREVDANYECGIVINGFNDFEENDIIEGYKITEVKRTLSSLS